MVEKAAAPVDVHWNNLNISTTERTERRVTTFLLTIGCIILGFLVVLALRYTFKNYFKLDNYSKKNEGLLILAGSVGVTILIICINNFTSTYRVIQNGLLPSSQTTRNTRPGRRRNRVCYSS